MAFHTKTRAREYRLGMIGRFRWYTCKACKERFRVFTRDILSKNERICVECKQKGG